MLFTGNKMVTVKFKKLDELVTLPRYQTEGAAGMDLHAWVPELNGQTRLTLQPGEVQLIPTGFAVEIPKGYYGAIVSRSGMALKGIVVNNSPGIVDSDFCSEVKIIIKNASTAPFTINRGDRIAQMLVLPVVQAEVTETDTIRETSRGAGSFGSTGTK
jgi:dUTP pyrophosphatase